MTARTPVRWSTCALALGAPVDETMARRVSAQIPTDHALPVPVSGAPPVARVFVSCRAVLVIPCV